MLEAKLCFGRYQIFDKNSNHKENVRQGLWRTSYGTSIQIKEKCVIDTEVGLLLVQNYALYNSFCHMLPFKAQEFWSSLAHTVLNENFFKYIYQ